MRPLDKPEFVRRRLFASQAETCGHRGISQVPQRLANASKGVLSLSQTPDRLILTESIARVNGVFSILRKKRTNLAVEFRMDSKVFIPSDVMAREAWYFAQVLDANLLRISAGRRAGKTKRTPRVFRTRGVRVCCEHSLRLHRVPRRAWGRFQRRRRRFITPPRPSSARLPGAGTLSSNECW